MKLDTTIRTLFPVLKIKDRDRNIIPFMLNPCQDLAAKILIEHEKDDRPLRFICDKSRQVGMSYFIEALLTAHCVANSNAQALIVAHQHKPAKNLFERATLMWESIPMRRRPERTQEKLEFPHVDGNSILMRATAGSVSVRSMTLSACHLSESAFYPNEEGMLAILPAIPERVGTIIAIESTANGMSGMGKQFYEYWTNAIEGRSDYIPIFIPWYTDPECERHWSECDDFPRDEAERELKRMFLELKFSDQQARSKIAWWRWALDNKCNGYVQKRSQEYPSTWVESFISSGDPAFTPEEISMAERSVALVIKNKLERSGYMEQTGGRPEFRESPRGKLRIFELPQAGHEYYVGADCARGPDDNSNIGDFSAAVVWDGTSGTQVAVFAERIGQEEFASILNQLGLFYNTARMNIELTGGIGSHVLHVLRDTYNYKHWYIWRGKRDDAQNRIGTKLCWETSWYSRERMFTAFREALRSGEAIISDRICLEQMKTAIRQDGRVEIVCEHDDILMATLIGWINRVDYPPQHGGYKVVRHSEADIQAAMRVRTPAEIDSLNDTFPAQRALARSIEAGDKLKPELDW